MKTDLLLSLLLSLLSFLSLSLLSSPSKTYLRAVVGFGMISVAVIDSPSVLPPQKAGRGHWRQSWIRREGGISNMERKIRIDMFKY